MATGAAELIDKGRVFGETHIRENVCDGALHAPLSAPLELAQLSGRTWCIVDLRGSGGFSLPPHAGAWVYCVLRGSVRVTCLAAGTVELQAGHVQVLLSGKAHAVRTKPDSLALRLNFLCAEQEIDHPPTITIGSGPLVARVLCGRLAISWPGDIQRSVIPSAILLGDDPGEIDINRRRVAALESFAMGPGAAALLTRVAAVLLGSALRARSLDAQADTAAHVGDPIARAQKLIERNVAKDWTVASLAEAVGMSRSGFATRFAEQVGRGPIGLITEHRMNLARQLLGSSDLTIDAIGARTGYRSAAGFYRRFRQYYGVSPSDMRRSLSNRDRSMTDPFMSPLGLLFV